MRFGLGLRRRESGASRAKRGERGGAGEKGAARNPSPRKAGRGRVAPRVLPSASPRTGSAERVRGRGRELPRPLTPTLSPQAGRGGSLAAACHILHRRSLTPAPLRCGRGGSELVRHRGAPVFAAFSASYHQIVGKAEPPYSGRARAGEAVPARRPGSIRVALRHDVVVGEEHAVERLRRGDQLVAVLREDDLLDQRVDALVLDAGGVARALPVGGRGAPELALLVAGRQRLRPRDRWSRRSRSCAAGSGTAPRRRCGSTSRCRAARAPGL